MNLSERRWRERNPLFNFIAITVHICLAVVLLFGGAIMFGALAKLVSRAFMFGWQLW